MTLFSANAPVAGKGPAYDVRPAREVAGFDGGRSLAGAIAGSRLFAPFNFARQMAQGACAGLLTLLGAVHLTAAVPAEEQSLEALTALDGASLEAIAESFLQGGAPGALEILGAVALFLNAGRGPARIIGLMGFVAIVAAHANGMDHADMLERGVELYELVQGYIQKFQTARPL